MDGVLYDSMPHHAEAWAKASDDFGLGITRHDMFMHEGRTGFSTIDIFTRKHWGRPTTHEEVERIYARKCEYYNQLPEALPMPGALTLLQQIRADGFQIVLVTGSAQHSLLSRLNRDYPGIFHSDLMVTGFDVTYGKPNPEPYLKAMAKVGVQPNECVVLENAPLGVQAGHTAGCFTVGVTTGPIPEKDMYKAGADVVYKDMASLLEALPALQEAFKQQQ